MQNLGTNKTKRILFLVANPDESCWKIIRRLESLSNVRLLVIQGRRSLVSQSITRASLIFTSILVAFRNAIFGEAQPPVMFPTNGSNTYTVKSLDEPEVLKKIIHYRPDIAILSAVKSIPKSITDLGITSLTHSPGMPMFYSGPHSLHSALKENNFNCLYVSVYCYERSKRNGVVLNAQYLCPYFREPFLLYRRRLGLLGADLLIDTLQDVWARRSVIQTFADETVEECIPDEDFDSTIKGGIGLSSRDLQRYILYQKFGSSVAKLPDTVSRIGQRRETVRHAETINRPTFKKIPSSTIRQLKTLVASRIYKRVNRDKIRSGFYVLNYHHICSDEEALYLRNKGIPNIYTSTSNFLSHLEFLDREFRCVSLNEGMELWRNGDAQHERIASITFDDGLTSPMRWIDEMNEINLRPSLFVCGDPLINDRPLNIHKSLFVHQYQKTNLADLDTLTQSFTQMMEDGFSQTDDFASFVAENYLSEEEVHHLLRDNRIGVLGSHTWSHRSLSHADSNSSFSENLEFQSYQIVDCHHALQERFQEGLQWFSYPFGKMDRQSFVSELLARKVCRDIFHCNGGINVTPCSIGSVLRISVRDLNRRELEQLLRIQWAR